jgi:GNAT superfamily N-acetyltransferase
MRAALPAAARSGWLGVARAADGPEEIAGVLIAARPDGWPFPRASLRARLVSLARQGPRIATRWAAVAEVLRENHPASPHWYLATIGVEPALWGQGVGGALLTALLAQVDASGLGAYLETDAPDRAGFYRRFGFCEASQLRVHGVAVLAMQRPPRPVRSP